LAESENLSFPKGVVIPLGADAPKEDTAALASQFLAKFPKARERRQILFLGRLHFKKGLDRILKALPPIVQAFPDVLLTVVGSGAPDYETTIRNAITAQGLQHNVMMTGRLDGAAKWGAYASAELFLLPSRQENFAITVAEAMQMGVPVVISKAVNTWPYVESSDAGLVLEEERIEATLLEGVLSLLKDRTTRTLMGKRGQEFARRNLTWAGAAARLMNCYEEVLLAQRSCEPNR
jgi:glycosyltransferase involved in cell wall biosynthesis